MEKLISVYDTCMIRGLKINNGGHITWTGEERFLKDDAYKQIWKFRNNSIHYYSKERPKSHLLKQPTVISRNLFETFLSWFCVCLICYTRLVKSQQKKRSFKLLGNMKISFSYPAPKSSYLKVCADYSDRQAWEWSRNKAAR